MVHKYQPNCLVSNRIGHRMGDYSGLGDNELPVKVYNDATETVYTHNDTWGYIERDSNWKNSKEVIRILVKCNAKGVNFMLNLGPRGDGSLPEMAVDILKNAGIWIEDNKESVYGTTYSPFPELSWGECTQRPGKLYLHVLNWPDNLKLRVPSVADAAKSVKLLVGGQELKYVRDGSDVLIDLPQHMPDSKNTVLVMEYKGDLNIDSVRTLMEDEDADFTAIYAGLSGNVKRRQVVWSEEFGSWNHEYVIHNWTAETDFAEWKFRAPVAGLYAVELEYSYPTTSPKREGLVMIDGN